MSKNHSIDQINSYSSNLPPSPFSPYSLTP